MLAMEKFGHQTSGGDIEIDYYGNNKGIEASTSGGGIHVKVPASLKANVYFETSGGDIESNFQIAVQARLNAALLKVNTMAAASRLC
jgi:DUF4097 and DUF4098 domain-containing protein YvlB